MKRWVGPNSDLLENSIFFSKPVGAKTHVLVGAKTCKSGGTKNVPPFSMSVVRTRLLHNVCRGSSCVSWVTFSF
jgi:hypothetical protein